MHYSGESERKGRECKFQTRHTRKTFTLVNATGISNTVGRVVLGWLVDFPWVNSLLVTNVSLVSSGICVLAFPACTDFAGFISVALMLG